MSTPRPGETIEEFGEFTEAMCSACGGRETKDRICHTPHMFDQKGELANAPVAMGLRSGGPHLHRTCQTCGNMWLVETFSAFLIRRERIASAAQ